MVGVVVGEWRWLATRGGPGRTRRVVVWWDMFGLFLQGWGHDGEQNWISLVFMQKAACANG